MDTKKIGEFISEIRKENQLTQEQLAEKLGVSNRSVSRWENGTTMPDLSILLQLCRELNIGIAELMNAQRKTPDADIDKSIQMILQLSDRDKERKAKKLNWLFCLGALFLSSIILHNLAQSAGVLNTPILDTGSICFLFTLGLIFEITGFYCNIKGSKARTFTEKEINVLVMDEKDLRMRESEEMLQVARKHQKAEFRQYKKAFQEIADRLETDEYAVFSMVAGSYSYNDSPGPWNVALVVTNKRLLICGETVRGRMFTGYVMDVFNRDDIRSVNLVNRKIVIKTTKGTVKMEGDGFASIINRLKSVF